MKALEKGNEKLDDAGDSHSGTEESEDETEEKDPAVKTDESKIEEKTERSEYSTT